MAIEVSSSTRVGGGGGGGLGSLLVLAGLGGAGYFGLQWWRREQVKKAVLAEAARLQAQGMSLEDSLKQAAGAACMAAGSLYRVPPSVSGPICSAAAQVALQSAKLTIKGAMIAGKAVGKAGAVVGKGAAAAGKAVGKGAAAAGKAVGTGAKAVAYTAPKKVIGGSVNKVDKVATAIVSKTIGKIAPKPVKKVAAAVHKVAKKAACLGIFCGVEGLGDADGYRSALEAALGDAGAARARNPFGVHGRHHRAAPTSPSPFARIPKTRAGLVGGAAAPGVRAAGRFGRRPGFASIADGPGYYARSLRR